MTYEKIFADLKKTIMKADSSTLEGSFAFQCCIEGEGAGTFYIAFADGKLSVEPYDYTDNTATFKASAETYKNILAGKTEVADALADGELVVEGNDAGCANILAFFAGKKPARKTAEKAAKKPVEKAKTTKTEAPKAAAKTEAPKAAVKTEAPKAAAKTEAPKAAVKTEAPKAGKKRGRK